MIGTSIADYKQTLNKVRKWLDENIKDDVRGLQTFDLRTGVHVVTAIEAPLLDLLGKFDAAIRQNFTSARTADAIDGSETDFGMLLRRNVNTGDTSHFLPL